MKYFRNVDVAREFLVNESTVRKWIRDSLQGKLNLTLEEKDGSFRIANTPKNVAVMRNISEARRKFRNSRAAKVDMPTNQFFGTWLSSHYKIADGPTAPKTEYYVTLHLLDDQLIVESIPREDKSYLFARFTLEGKVATGVYHSENAPNTRAKDVVYYGSAQLILDEDGKALHGMGVGFDRDMKTSATAWSIVHISDDAPAAQSASGK